MIKVKRCRPQMSVQMWKRERTKNQEKRYFDIFRRVVSILSWTLWRNQDFLDRRILAQLIWQNQPPRNCIKICNKNAFQSKSNRTLSNRFVGPRTAKSHWTSWRWRVGGGGSNPTWEVVMWGIPLSTDRLTEWLTERQIRKIRHFSSQESSKVRWEWSPYVRQ